MKFVGHVSLLGGKLTGTAKTAQELSGNFFQRSKKFNKEIVVLSFLFFSALLCHWSEELSY